MVDARVLCTCHCRINLMSTSSRQKRRHHVLITFKCTMEGCKRDINARACLDKEGGDTIISEGHPLWAGAHISGNLEHDTRPMARATAHRCASLLFCLRTSDQLHADVGAFTQSGYNFAQTPSMKTEMVSTSVITATSHSPEKKQLIGLTHHRKEPKRFLLSGSPT